MNVIPGMFSTFKHCYGNFRDDEFKQRKRSLELTIINGTDRCLRFKDEYFSTGTWFLSPQPLVIKPSEGSLLYVVSREKAMSGVAGGLEYELDGTDMNLYMGFSNPILGCYKSFIQLNSYQSAKWACSNCLNDTVKHHKNNGYLVTATMRSPFYSPFRRIEYTIIRKPWG